LAAIVVLDESMQRRTEVEPHSAGTLRHAYVISGRVRLGPLNATVDLEPGDFVRHPGDGVHVVDGLGKQATRSTS
jgi:quercetin dioxygenase-like cupin family protein